MPIEDRFYRIVVDALTHDRLTLPTPPEVALRLRQLLQDENVSSSRLAAEIQRDPAIAVRLVRIANSAALRTGTRVENVQQAVMRLGFAYTRILVDGLALEQMYRAPHPLLADRLTRCWRESVEVAALSRAIAAECTMLPPDVAMLAGLVHRVGVLPILRLAETHAAALASPQVFDEVVEALSPRIGRLVLQAWHFPDALVEVPAAWPDFTRRHEAAPDYADVVAVAVLRIRRARDPVLHAVDPAMVSAYARLDLEPDFDLGGAGPLANAYADSLELLQAA